MKNFNSSPILLFLLFLLLLLLTTLKHAASARTPSPYAEVCKRNPSHTASARHAGDNGYQVVVQGAEEFKPGHVYQVGIVSNGTEQQQMFNGFMLTAVASNATMEALGTFMLSDFSEARQIGACPHIISHADFRGKRQVMLAWKAPLQQDVCVEIRATVLERNNVWFKDEGKLTKIFCPEDPPEAIVDTKKECCACGSAKYELVFEGIWSEKSHPVSYPTQKRLLHWANIVGASHNHKYHIWKYGGHATRGVKEVCELGYPRTLEGEVKKQGRNVRTLIKTTGIWWRDPEGIVQNRSARFSADPVRHLVSLITMLGPSPDWCVGINSVNVCNDDCTWSDGFVVDLQPWDAGTDDGVSYMSPNAKSDPQQRIRKITNRWPNHPESPFYGPHPITPVARLHVKKIGETKPASPAQCRDEASTDFLGEGSSSPDQQSISAKCMVSEWEDWSRCSVTCGVGTRSRRRMYKNAGVEGQCDVALLETENCIGLENECESMDEDCGLTQWSDWSPCSVTCGQGQREKIRYYFVPEDSEKCNRTTTFKEVCSAGAVDCKTSKKDSKVCQLPLVKGPCRGAFQMWHYDVTMKKCLPFEYGGCRGNENRFETMEECTEVCAEGEKQEATAEIDLSFCMQVSDRGSCGGAGEEMWYYDKAMQKCLSFTYSGCGGNRNRFKTMDECSDACLLVGLEGGGADDDMLTKCQQPALEGPCGLNLEKWYFDVQMQKCLPFQYGGCNGNDNNFETMDQCTDLCTLNAQLQDALLKKAVSSDFLQTSGVSRYKRFCTLPPLKGPCRDDLTRWYFDLSTLQCLSFEYGGCLGNANNFESIEMCKDSCMSKSGEDGQAGRQESRQEGRQADGQASRQEGRQASTPRALATTISRGESTTDQQNDEMQKMMEKMKSMKKMKGDLDCKMSQWSGWSACSASCGRGSRRRERKVLQQATGKGRRCLSRLVRKQPCRRLPPCKKECQYGPWSGWSACSKSCGMASFKIRTQKALPHPFQHPFHHLSQPPSQHLSQHPSQLPSQCPLKSQRAICRLPECPR